MDLGFPTFPRRTRSTPGLSIATHLCRKARSLQSTSIYNKQVFNHHESARPCACAPGREALCYRADGPGVSKCPGQYLNISNDISGAASSEALASAVLLNKVRSCRCPLPQPMARRRRLAVQYHAVPRNRHKRKRYKTATGAPGLTNTGPLRCTFTLLVKMGGCWQSRGKKED